MRKCSPSQGRLHAEAHAGDIEELAIDSFDTLSLDAQEGSVRAHSETDDLQNLSCYDSFHWCVVTHIRCCGTYSANPDC